MKILVLSHMYPTLQSQSYGIFVQEQVKELIWQGHEVKVVSPVAWAGFPLTILDKKWRNYAELPQKENRDQVEIFHPRVLLFPRNINKAYSGDTTYWGIKALVKKIYQDFPFDLIHAHVALPDGYAGVKLAKDLGVPCAVTIHGQDLQHTVKMNKTCLTKIAYCLKHADSVILVSNKLKRLANEYFPAYHHKFTVINNGIDKTLIKAESATKDRVTDKTKLLSVSNLIHTKGLNYNLEAFACLLGQFPDLCYTIVGAGPEETKLKKLTADLKISDKVTFVGSVPHDQVMSYMSDCDIFTLPSWNEGFGVVYIEAMAHGKPVIACAGEGIDGIVRDKVTGMLVQPKSTESLITALQYLLENPRNAAEIGSAAKELVLNHFTWEQNVKQHVMLYRQLIA